MIDRKDVPSVITIVDGGDPVNHPSHYTRVPGMEVIDILEGFFSDDPLLWQVGKYLLRAGHKDSTIQDLKKAQWYLTRRISKEEN